MKIYADATFTVVIDVDPDDYEATSRVDLAKRLGEDPDVNEHFGNEMEVVDFVGLYFDDDEANMEYLDTVGHHYRLTLEAIPQGTPGSEATNG